MIRDVGDLNKLNEKQKANTQKSGNWLKNAWKNAKKFFKDEYKNIKKNAKKVWNNLKQTTGTNKTRKVFEAGNLVAFNYDAKHKQKKYDKNPLVIMLGPSRKYKDLYLGLNIHWIKNPQERTAIASYFLELKNKRNGTLVYDDVKPWIKKYKDSPVLRSYYYNRVSKRVYQMEDEQYLVAAAIPSEKIVGGISQKEASGRSK